MTRNEYGLNAHGPKEPQANEYKPRRALIVVDVQNDFITGSLAVPGAEGVVAGIAELIESGDYDTVVATQDWHKDPGDHFTTWPVHGKAGTHGAEFAPGYAWKFDSVFRKGQYSDGYSGFEGRNAKGQYLSDYLRSNKIDHVDVVGLVLDHCVKATAIDAPSYGLITRVLTKHTVATHIEAISPSIKELKQAGVVVA